MSSSQTNYKLDEAQAIFNELRSIKKAISTGERERQDLIQSLAKLTVNFQSGLTTGEGPASPGSPGGDPACTLQQYCDTGCQTDIMGEYGGQEPSQLVDKVKLNWQYEEAKKKVQSIQHQLAQLDSESWSGRAEADRDRDFLHLLREKEALLQEVTLVSGQRCPPDMLQQLEERRRGLEEEVQRAHTSQSQGANQRILLQEKRNVLLRQLEEATRITTYLHTQLKSLSASSLTVSSSSSRGSLASSRGSLASSRGSLSSISFSDIYGPPQYERHDPTSSSATGDLHDPTHLRYLLPPDATGLSPGGGFCPADPLLLTQGGIKAKRSHDNTPQSLASLSSRSSLSSLSPPSSPMDTPYHSSAPPDCPLAQMTEEYMELAGGRGLLEGLRGPQGGGGGAPPHHQSPGPSLPGAPPPAPGGGEELAGPGANLHLAEGKGHREGGGSTTPQGAFTSSGVTLRCNSANRSGRRARRVSTGVSEDALATDSGVFEAWGRRAEESEEMSYMKDLTTASEAVQIQLGLLYDSSSQSLLLHLLQLKHLNKAVVRDGYKVYVKVHLIPLDAGRACAFYCCKALEPTPLMSFNEGFRIPVPPGALAACALQLSLCSLGPQAQEELLGTAQVSLADCDGGTEMAFCWLRVQAPGGSELHHRRHHADSQEEQQPRRPSTTMDAVCALLSRATTSSTQEEGGGGGGGGRTFHMMQTLDNNNKKEEACEAASERSWQAESVDSGCSNSAAFVMACPDSLLCTEGVCVNTGGRCGQPASKPPTLKVEKATMTEGMFPEPLRVRPPKERGGGGGRWGHASPFMRSSTLVRSQTFSPGARSQYVCRLYRSDSDSSTLPKKSPFVRNTLERRTLRYKQQQQSYNSSSLAEQPTRTSLDLELDLQACRVRQRQLTEELSTLRELKLRLEEPPAAAGGAGPSGEAAASELPHWALRDERFRGLLREAQRQANQSKQEQRQEEAAERRLRKANKEVLQMRGQSHKEPLPVQTFREKMAFFTRPRFNIPPLPADDV